MHRTFCFIFFCFAVSCASDATPAGTQIFSTDVSETAGAETTHEVEITMDADEHGATTVALKIAAVKAEDGLHLTTITGTVKEAGGWQVTKTSAGNPYNVGTEDAPIMAVPIILSRYRESGCGQYANSSSWVVRADGEVAKQ